MGLILLVLLVVLIFAALGIALHVLWVIAGVLLVIWLLGFLVSGAEHSWYRVRGGDGRSVMCSSWHPSHAPFVGAEREVPQRAIRCRVASSGTTNWLFASLVVNLPATTG